MKAIKYLAFFLFFILTGYVGYYIGEKSALIKIFSTSKQEISQIHKSTANDCSVEKKEAKLNVGNIDIKNIQEIAKKNPEALIKMMPSKKVISGMLDSFPIEYLVGLVSQATNIPTGVIFQTDNPRLVTKKILYDLGNDMDIDVEDEKIVNSDFNANLLISNYINRENMPIKYGDIIYSGKKYVYFTFDLPKNYGEKYLNVILKVTNTYLSRVTHYSWYRLKNNKRNHIWIKRQWKEGLYNIEIMLIDKDIVKIAKSEMNIQDKIKK